MAASINQARNLFNLLVQGAIWNIKAGEFFLLARPLQKLGQLRGRLQLVAALPGVLCHHVEHKQARAVAKQLTQVAALARAFSADYAYDLVLHFAHGSGSHGEKSSGVAGSGVSGPSSTSLPSAVVLPPK